MPHFQVDSYIDLLIYRKGGMIEQGYSNYIDSLKTVYKNDHFRKEILEATEQKGDHGVDNKFTVSISYSPYKYQFNNTNILNEFSEIENHFYDMIL